MEYLLLGMGKSNVSVAKFFEKKKIKYCWWDDYNSDKLVNTYPFLKDKIYTEDNVKRIILKSGGVSNSHPLLKTARLIISDLELYYLYNNINKVITVTGTNGKSTCVSLIKHLINDINLGGNIGIPLGEFIEEKKDIVIEASSYMLEYTNLYHSKYNVLLNLSPNHLDYHGSFDEYVKCKMKLFKNCNENDYIIYNYDDINVRSKILELDTKARKIPVSKNAATSGVYIINDYVYLFNRPIMHISEIKLEEVYLMDAMCAIVVSYLYGISIYEIRNRVKSFIPLKYRLSEKIINDKIIYNDSKSTNISSMISAIKAISKKHKDKSITLICGGMKRYNIDIYHELLKSNLDIDNLNEVIIYGSARKDYQKYFENKYPIKVISKLQELDHNQINGEVILFSPGAPSFDEFESYQKRGEYFDQIFEIF